MKFMILGFILRSSEIFRTQQPIRYEYLRKFVTKEDQKKFNV